MLTSLDSTRQALVERLERPRYEVLPLGGIVEEVVAHVPPQARVTVTASPSKVIEATVQTAERIAAHGFNVVPHLSARLIRDRAQLEELAGRLLAAGVREIFVPAGDADPPAGEFAGAVELLRAMGELRDAFAEVGITGYPESHHLISDEETIQSMFAKAPMATCIISQICFDPATIAAWIREVRRRGTDLTM